MKLIVACDLIGGIGYQNKLPWSSLEDDLKRFKILTTLQTIVMGRNTWDSLPRKPLSNRTNIVISTQSLNLPESVIQIKNLDELKNYNDIWIIGGSQLINSCWNLIDTIHLTTALSKYTCDCYINLLQLENEFVKISHEDLSDNTYSVWKRK